MSSIHLPYQKVPRWNIDRATIAHNCARLGLSLVPLYSAPFWERVGNKLFEYSGHNVVGDLEGTSLPTWKDDYLDFGSDSNNARVDLGTPDHLLFTTQDWCTEVICLWRDTTEDMIITRGEYGVGGWFADNYLQKFGVYVRDGGGNDRLTNVGSVAIDTWYHWFWGKSGNTIYQHVYENGKLLVSGSIGITNGIATTSHRLLLGIYHNETEYELNGNIKLVNFWPKYLSAAQRQQRVNNPYGLFEPIRSPQWIVPLGATSVAPTSLAPTSLAPTSLAPTSLAPTTSVPPTSLAPTTVAPTTPIPTTAAPTTAPPTSVPTTLAPTTLAPTTPTLTTVAPTTGVPEEICVRDLNSTIIEEISLRSVITKETTFNGYLC